MMVTVLPTGEVGSYWSRSATGLLSLTAQDDRVRTDRPDDRPAHIADDAKWSRNAAIRRIGIVGSSTSSELCSLRTG